MIFKGYNAQVKQLASDEDEKLAQTNSYTVLPPYDQATALGKSNIDVGRIATGLPCGSEGFLLMYARWKKLERDLYNERKEYDLLHNAHLNIEGLVELFKVAQQSLREPLGNWKITRLYKGHSPTSVSSLLLADGVIPNEYGINPKQKLKIGSKIARRLLGKILIDLRNTREEAISVAEPKEDVDYQSKSLAKHDDARRSSSTSEKSLDQDDDEDKETKYRLDPKYANVKTPERHVRTRLYFTSVESTSKKQRQVALEDPMRFRIEMTFSRGADLSPLEYNDHEAASLHQEHTLPIMGPERLQEAGSYLTLEKMEMMIRPFAMPAEDFPPPANPQGFSGYFKGAGVLERLVNPWPFHKHAANHGK
ncbi:hypothetical protein QJS10_CPB12g00824 [Acorus calamus]|uniref:Uncharacterized protein n=1 Tax=Acorus calamus TaxID=4465 RepID=A0AAV9DNA6_ACOCL|nr:hypothetical protein QJS10_CPB12g00824 [Acorus calamus]